MSVVDEEKTFEELVQAIKDKKEKEKKKKLIESENKEEIIINWAVYRHYIFEYIGGCCFLTITNFAMILFTMAGIASDYVIGDWAQQTDQQSKVVLYSGLSLSFAILTSTAIAFRASVTFWFSLKGDKKLHNSMMKKVVSAPINLFFDITPIGRLINKFSTDLNQQARMATIYGNFLGRLYILLQVVIVATYTLWYFVFLFPMLLVFSFKLYWNVAKTLKETNRILATTSSPLISNLTETIQGTSTIRAFGYEEKFI